MGQKRIIELVNGHPKARVVTEAELKALNTPKEPARPGKYDADIALYGDRFGVRNAVFGNK